ncbi:hypothetical protein KKB40_01365 [Patescibacteria group bacterium]|nr:hypothetical protein [Patescibacteria group bacterium]
METPTDRKSGELGRLGSAPVVFDDEIPLVPTATFTHRKPDEDKPAPIPDRARAQHLGPAPRGFEQKTSE